MKKSSIALSLIVKDEVEEIDKLLDYAHPFFDQIYITVSDKAAYSELKKLDDDIATVDYRKWNDNFADARNHALSLIKEDYWMWFDADDIVDLKNLPALVERMDEEKLDAIYLPYNYAHDENGNCIAVHWRERILRTSHPFKWLGAVHETLISTEGPMTLKTDDIVIVHNNTKEDAEKSSTRNHSILEREWVKTGDPRYAHYLGLSYFNRKEYQKSIEIMQAHIKASGWDEESYRSQVKIAEAYFMMGENEKGIDSALVATKILPEYPDAYFVIAQIYFESDEADKCLSWIKTAKSKPVPDTLSMIDPSMYGYRSTMLAAMANMHLGKFDVAYLLIQEVLDANPNYKLAVDLLPDFQNEYAKWLMVDKVKDLATTLPTDKFAVDLYNALPEEVKKDPRLYTLKKKAIPPKKWKKGSIVFFCGKTTEDWGPDTLDKGMGGSEEAIVYLSRELRDLGHEVTIYNTREVAFDDNGVKYLPWHQFEYRDTYDTLVVWRAPELANSLTAKNLFVDLHDVKNESQLLKSVNNVDKFFVKSKYHRKLFPNIPDDKFVIVGNGILPSQFKANRNKTIDVGYFSAPNRGLVTLLELWPQIKKKIPDATGIWNYGWESYVAFNGEDALYKKVKRLLKDAEDFTEGKRISHVELAKTMGKTKVWAYPTEFPEIHCITALKAQESGMWPVTTPVAALTETVQDGDVIDAQDIYTNKEAQAEFVEKVVAGIKKNRRPKKMVGVSWKEVGQVWSDESKS